MKIKILLCLVFVVAFSSFTFTQTVKITPKKTVYKRKNPEAADYKRSFTITYPKISGVSAALIKKIEANLSFEKAFEFSLKDEISTDYGLDSADFTVLYNKFGILNVELSEDVSGAYPSTINKSIVIDTKTGERVKAADIFVKLPELAAKVKKSQAAEIKKGISLMKKESPDIENPAEYFSNTGYTVENLDDFSVSDKGITFRYDYEFAHVMLALQPDGRFFYSWAQLKPFIKRGGLLARFNR
ncbi:MAG: hypothetical protein WA584_01840 [Pyrinomonadaceae bacterium]